MDEICVDCSATFTRSPMAFRRIRCNCCAAARKDRLDEERRKSLADGSGTEAKRERKRKSIARESFWRTQLAVFSESKQTGVEFCRERGLSYSQFGYWKMNIPYLERVKRERESIPKDAANDTTP